MRTRGSHRTPGAFLARPLGSSFDPRSDNPYRYLEIRGTIADIRKDTSNRFINSLAKKDMDKDEYPEPGEGRVVVKIAPERFTSMG